MRVLTPELDVFLTHSHLDHVVGLSFLFDILVDRQVERVTVHAQQEKIAAIPVLADRRD